MERNPQDQNLGDAPDDENKIFNPANTLSEPSDKKPVGPLGEQKDTDALASTPTDENPVGQANQPKRGDEALGKKPFSETTDPEKLSDL